MPQSLHFYASVPTFECVNPLRCTTQIFFGTQRLPLRPDEALSRTRHSVTQKPQSEGILEVGRKHTLPVNFAPPSVLHTVALVVNKTSGLDTRGLVNIGLPRKTPKRRGRNCGTVFI